MVFIFNFCNWVWNFLNFVVVIFVILVRKFVLGREFLFLFVLLVFFFWLGIFNCLLLEFCVEVEKLVWNLEEVVKVLLEMEVVWLFWFFEDCEFFMLICIICVWGIFFEMFLFDEFWIMFWCKNDLFIFLMFVNVELLFDFFIFL